MPKANNSQLKHLKFEGAPITLQYRGRGRDKPNIVPRDRAQHAAELARQLAAVEQVFEDAKTLRRKQNLSEEFGLVLHVSAVPGFPLKFPSLEQSGAKTTSIEVLNVRQVKDDTGRQKPTVQAALFVPFGRLDILKRKVEAYGDPSKDGPPDQQGTRHPKNEALLANVSCIAAAAMDALWTDPEPMPQGDEPHWWELWIRRSAKEWEDQFLAECRRLEISVPTQRLVLPDHVIVVVHTTRRHLESSVDLLNTLAEIRKPWPCRLDFLDLSRTSQEEWINEALNRLEWPGPDAPAVCLIDTGVNRANPLIEPLLAREDCHTILTDADLSDSQDHGTRMAGMAAYGDLRELLLSTEVWKQLHRLESVKQISTGAEHHPKNYGAVTQQCIFLPEISAPLRPRVFCLAITRGTSSDDGRPSSWSAAIDSALSGSQEDGEHKRLLIVSAGNWRRDLSGNYRYPETLYDARIEDPAQAWNAITVGACTHRTRIGEDDDEATRCRALAPEGGLGPASRTSLRWEKRWPIKPDIVMEGGNLAVSGDSGDLLLLPSLQPLTIPSASRLKPISTFHDTSAATALASRVAARLLQNYPHLRLETIRALMVHSARWTPQMLEHGKIDPHSSGSSMPVESLLRKYGFGVLDEERALASFENRATFVYEQDLQPYKGEAGTASLNEFHLLRLPWPQQLLESAPDHPVTLRITLSYFVEPNPGSRAWEKNPKYRYPGCLLRFGVKHKDMDAAEFRSRLERQPEDDEEEEPPVGSDSMEGDIGRRYSDPGWALGRLRGKAGSLVQDVWQGTTGQLAEMGQVAIYPVKGWWATRKFPAGHEHHDCHKRRVCYSLAVSIETPADLPLYSSIEAALLVASASPRVASILDA